MDEIASGIDNAVDGLNQEQQVSDEVVLNTGDVPVEQPTTEEAEQADGESVERKKEPGWIRYRRQAQTAKQELAQVQAELAALKASALPQVEPKRENYLDDEQYIRDKVAYLTHTETTKVLAQAKEHTVKQDWSSRVEELKESEEEFKDYDKVTGRYDKIQVNPGIAKALRDSEHGPKLAYHIAKNPDLFLELNNLSEDGAYLKALDVDSSITSERPKAKTPKLPAPPIKTVQGTSKTATSLKDLDTSSYLASRYPGLR